MGGGEEVRAASDDVDGVFWADDAAGVGESAGGGDWVEEEVEGAEGAEGGEEGGEAKYCCLTYTHSLQ